MSSKIDVSHGALARVVKHWRPAMIKDSYEENWNAQEQQNLDSIAYINIQIYLCYINYKIVPSFTIHEFTFYYHL